MAGMASFGSPVSVRTDHGGENIDIWRHMLFISNNNPSSVITGSSTHNVRVERMWRDMRKSVTSTFSSTFSTIESDGLFDPLNDVDTFCLHYVYLPCINQCLQEFQESWNRHSMSTEGNMSPYQMFYEGLSAMQNRDAQSQSNSGAANIVDVPDRVEIPGNSFSPCEHLNGRQPLTIWLFQLQF